MSASLATAAATGRLPVSAVLITRDCAHQLPDTLAALAFCDEIVVVDSGSQDDTVAVARAQGARVLQEPWRGFGPQRQFAIEQARHDWVLCIDAGEVVTPALRASIEAAVHAPTFTAFEFARLSSFMGRELRHGEAYPAYAVRFFDRRVARWSEDILHEKVLSLQPVGRLSGDLASRPRPLPELMARQNELTSLAAELMMKEGTSPGRRHLLLSPVFRFIKYYVMRGGFLDGTAGFVYAVLTSYSSFSKYSKAIEMGRVRKMS
ncbi:glycosyltransferase family 2 protein [Uliginosibacterium sp. H1]|uniref:glycosyltransferase family 2 protein n=1 Tax=Uliginosibacterium sp. H1 TaxID=3114757 RepID=UPI002E18DF7D|nr:glycosyltransferase family 2 protein [Uliginosibacterium sp. H1]